MTMMMLTMMFWKEFYLQLPVTPHGFCLAAPLSMDMAMKCFSEKPEAALSSPPDLQKSKPDSALDPKKRSLVIMFCLNLSLTFRS